MASAPRSVPTDETCHRCGGELVAQAAYCEKCGTRTRHAARMVRFWARLEMIFLLLFTILVIAFSLLVYLPR